MGACLCGRRDYGSVRFLEGVICEGWGGLTPTAQVDVPAELEPFIALPWFLRRVGLTHSMRHCAATRAACQCALCLMRVLIRWCVHARRRVAVVALCRAWPLAPARCPSWRREHPRQSIELQRHRPWPPHLRGDRAAGVGTCRSYPVAIASAKSLSNFRARVATRYSCLATTRRRALSLRPLATSEVQLSAP